MLPYHAGECGDPRRSGYFSGVVVEDKEQLPTTIQARVDTFVIAAVWLLWKQRNARVFNRAEQVSSPIRLAQQILDEIKTWKLAGVGVVGLSRFVRE